MYIAVRTKFSTHVLYLRVSFTYFLKVKNTLASSVLIFILALLIVVVLVAVLLNLIYVSDIVTAYTAVIIDQ